MITQENIFTLTENYPLKWYEVDFLKILKPSSLLNILQDCATQSADKIGIGYNFLVSRNYAWFLIKYHMEFEDYPQNVENLILKTESRGTTKLFAIRDFELYDGNKLLGRVSSQWAIIDLEKKSFVPMKMLSEIPPFEKREDDISFLKPVILEQYDIEKSFEIRYDDIDINRHVNNANYVIWAMETIPFDFRKTHKIKTMDIVYKKEISFGQNVLSKLMICENKTCHLLVNKETEEQLCAVDITWQNS